MNWKVVILEIRRLRVDIKVQKPLSGAKQLSLYCNAGGIQMGIFNTRKLILLTMASKFYRVLLAKFIHWNLGHFYACMHILDKEKYLKFSARKELIKNYFSIYLVYFRIRSGLLLESDPLHWLLHMCTSLKWPHLYRKFRCSEMKKGFHHVTPQPSHSEPHETPYFCRLLSSGRRIFSGNS